MTSPVRLVYADHRLVALNKPAGLSLATGRSSSVAATQRLLQGLDPTERTSWGLESDGLWLVHRLDVGTSGLVLLARDPDTHRALVHALSTRQIDKTYLALVWGRPRPPAGQYLWPLAPDTRDRRRMRVAEAGKPAASAYRVLGAASGVSLVELTPHTGRTHQLRVHLAHAGHPVVGDDLYTGPRHRGVRDPILRAHLHPDHPFLHAWQLAIPPLAGAGGLILEAPLPSDLLCALRALGGAIAQAMQETELEAPGLEG